MLPEGDPESPMIQTTTIRKMTYDNLRTLSEEDSYRGDLARTELARRRGEEPPATDFAAMLQREVDITVRQIREILAIRVIRGIDSISN